MLQTKETVNHPDHYQTRRGIEAIDVMEAFTENMSGDEAVLTATILKYSEVGFPMEIQVCL